MKFAHSVVGILTKLKAHPNLPVPKKVEVLVERFDAPIVSFANKT